MGSFIIVFCGTRSCSQIKHHTANSLYASCATRYLAIYSCICRNGDVNKLQLLLFLNYQSSQRR
jgi:hypothetical protein